MFANDTWGGAFDWLAHGDDDTRFELSRLGAYLGARDAALPLFVGMPGHRHYPCKPAAGPLRAADPFACCVDDSQPCRVDVPPSKPYFSFELNRSDTRTIGPGVGGGPGDGTVVVTPCRRRGKRKPCCPVRQRHDDGPFPYRYHPTRGRVHYHNLASWAYGGIGYYVSRGLLAEITRHEWQACADKLVCLHKFLGEKAVAQALCRVRRSRGAVALRPPENALTTARPPCVSCNARALQGEGIRRVGG